ncbi:MAG: ammonia-forming cytochrome c nitrite reductase subunit c552, partial [Pseudomonadota bacterium]
ARMVGDLKAYLAKVDAPKAAPKDETLEAHWAASAHAAGDVTCAGCHAPDAKTEDEIAAAWVDAPGYDVCADCHRGQAKTFARGRHGMRSHPKIAKPRSVKKQLKNLGWKKPDPDTVALLEKYLDDETPPTQMTVAEARIPMKESAHGLGLSCGSCHTPHEQNLRTAAVESCASCHDDTHTQAYFDSPHYVLWQAELAGEAPAGSGVSCATCHMPKSEEGGKIQTTHNQNTVLRPNEKMLRPVCMDCHGLGFAIDALADPDLVARNFKGRPQRHIESIDWAVRRVETGDQAANR